MKKKKIKLVCLGLLTTLAVSATPVLAATNVSNSNLSTITTVDNQEVVRVHAKKGDVKKYNINNAPEQVISQLKAANVELNSTLEIYASDTTANATTSLSGPSEQLYYAYQPSTGIIAAVNGTRIYYANIYSDVVGYGHQTSGSAVGAAQVILAVKYYNISIDTYFGTQTQGAVLDWQDNHGLMRDGIIGYNTWYSLVNN